MVGEADSSELTNWLKAVACDRREGGGGPLPDIISCAQKRAMTPSSHGRNCRMSKLDRSETRGRGYESRPGVRGSTGRNTRSRG